MEIELDKTEQKIVDATIFLLDKEGMNGTTTKKIAKKAEVSEVTVFRKFKSKDNLLKIAKIYYSDYFLEKISDIFINYEDTDLESLLKNTWWKLVNFLDNNLDIIKIALDELMSNPEEEKIFSKFSEEVLKNHIKYYYDSEPKKIMDILLNYIKKLKDNTGNNFRTLLYFQNFQMKFLKI